MTTQQLLNMRLMNQQIASPSFTDAGKLVQWMGALQAQDYAMSKWAVGLRLKKATEETIETAIDKGEIIRTHVLRPTWHFVSAEDVYDMLALSAPTVKALGKFRHKELELNETVFSKAYKLLKRILADENHLTREELYTHFEKAKISVNGERLSHILVNAELDAIICSGITKAKKHSFALFEERIKPRKFNKDAALETLATKYFQSHGPATEEDFKWWSGLSAKDVKAAIEMIKPRTETAIVNKHTFLFMKDNSTNTTRKKSLYILPAIDEYVISYKDRSMLVTDTHRKNVFTNNGIFNPVIIFKGKVCGVWSRTIVKNKVSMSPVFFEEKNEKLLPLTTKSFKRFSVFLKKKATAAG